MKNKVHTYHFIVFFYTEKFSNIFQNIFNGVAMTHVSTFPTPNSSFARNIFLRFLEPKTKPEALEAIKGGRGGGGQHPEKGHLARKIVSVVK